MTDAAIFDPVTDYARRVVLGFEDPTAELGIKAGWFVREACKRHLHDLKAAKRRGWYWCLGQPSTKAAPAKRGTAWHAIEFVQALPQFKGKWSGQTLHLEPWQAFIVGSIFGWRNKKGRRRFSIAYVQIARKNGKSTLGAAIGLYMLVADGEPAAEVYSAATKRDQAKIVWGTAQEMARRSPPIWKRIKSNVRNLNVPATSSKFEPLGADEDGMDGLNVSCAIVDELHAHKTRVIWDTLETATGAREQPIMLGITTAGYSRNIAWDMRGFIKKLLEGSLPKRATDHVFGYVAELDEGDDWLDQTVWIKANPNLAVSVFAEDLQKAADVASKLPAAQNAFRVKRLNQWVEQEVRWLPIDRWDACAAPIPDAALAGRRCYFGMDLSAKTDLTSICLLFEPTKDDPKWRTRSFFWIPEERIKQVVAGLFVDQVPYDVWREQGLIRAHPGEGIDQDLLRIEYREIFRPYRIVCGGFDSWNAAQMAIWLQKDGYQIYEVRQGVRTLSEPMKLLQKEILDGEIAHDGNDVMRWNMSNIAIRSDENDNIAPSKKRSGGRIDGVVALIMAKACAMWSATQPTSPYEDRGLIVLS